MSPQKLTMMNFDYTYQCNRKNYLLHIELSCKVSRYLYQKCAGALRGVTQVHRASSQKAQACLWSSGSREIATTKWVECFQSIFRLSNFSNFGLRAKASSTNSASHFRACSELRRHRRARRARNSRPTPSGLSRSNLDQARLETPSPVPHYKF